ncbi:unnamed protein product, partial [Ixodes persulcatus]
WNKFSCVRQSSHPIMRTLLCVALAVGLVQAATENCKPETTVSADDDDVVITVDDIERIALKNLDDGPRGYYQSGADDQQTLTENKHAFRRFQVSDLLLMSLSTGKQCFEVRGRYLLLKSIGTTNNNLVQSLKQYPEIRLLEEILLLLCIAPLRTKRVKARRALPIASLWSMFAMRQTYSFLSILIMPARFPVYGEQKHEHPTPAYGGRRTDMASPFAPKNKSLANFDGKELSSLSSASGSGLEAYANSLFDQSLTWADVQWLKNLTFLPIILKGILTAEDAVLAVRNGIPAIIVSNHGGRQLDGVASTIEVLPKIMRAVYGRIEVYLDGGVRQGTDVVKALALGAKMVFVGRPALWGLAFKGQQGVEKMLEIFREEIDRAMALLGSRTLGDLRPQLVARQEYYASL